MSMPLDPTPLSQSTLLTRVEQLRDGLHAVRRTRRALLSVGVLLAVLVVAQTARLVFPSVAAMSWAVWGAVGLLLAGVMYLWRAPVAPDVARTALWVEERAGREPDFSLTTAIELLATRQPAGETLLAAASRVLERAPLREAITADKTTAWRGPAIFAVCCLLLLAIGATVSRGTTDTASVASSVRSGPAREAAAVSAPMGAWTIQVQPPAYTELPARTLGDVNNLTALRGSRVVLRGEGDPPMVALQRLAGDSSRAVSPVRADSTGTGWQTSVTATAAPLTLTLSRGGTRRLLVVEGRADSVPLVSLDAPARDSVFREARGVLPLIATARDDIGLSRASLELLVSSGEGERFTVKAITRGDTRWNASSHTRTVTLRSSLDLAALGLQPGDVVHLRAVARDGHPESTREFGSSETRAFRIARPAEYDSLAVEPAPPPEVDKSLMSQRMLLMLTEKLDKAQRRMARPEVVRESLRLARDQARLRLAVGDVVFQRLSGESSAEHAHAAGDGHDHGVELQGGKLAMSTSSTTGMLEEGNDSPVVAINQPLLEAYNAMWDAGRALEQGDPHAAIPPMKRALEAIERSRAASRLYLRGKPPQVIVDIAKVRLAGKDTGRVNVRSARVARPTGVAARDARLVQVAQLANSNVAAARDSLAVLRAESLVDAPAFAEALSRTLEAMSGGGDVTTRFVEARRVLGIVVRTRATTWSRGVVP
ncbi:DUF4175 family protein [Gemmatimonas sp.]|uniref:DUF4175 family protein n=1 Tax=Gemmatimonas sp. TaxID=1962908 RepID=UPI003F7016FC